jgi:RecJ-like exonuclease
MIGCEAGGVIQVLEPEGMSLTVRVSWRDGEVRVRCPECAMHLPDAEPGRVLCPACDGTGIRGDCENCYGTGIGSTPDVACGWCGGTGEAACPYCDASGTVPCPECRGRGHVSWDQAGAWLAREAEKVRRRAG